MSGRGGGGCPGGEALSAFLDRETEGPWHEAIARHLRGCQRCREQLGRLERLRELLAKDPAPEPRSSLATLRQRLAQAGRGLAWRLPFWRRRIVLPLPAAAAAALASWPWPWL